MNLISLFDGKTATDVRIDAPIDSTVRIPPRRGTIVWRLLCGVAVVVFSVYALIHQALDYEPRAAVVATFSPREERDIRQEVRDAIYGVRYVTSYGREWRMFVTVVALLSGMFTVFREMKRLQATETGVILSPSGLTVYSEASRRFSGRVPWTEIESVGDGRFQGRVGVALAIRHEERFLDETTFFKRLFRKSGDKRIVLAAGSLQIANGDLKTLLTRYMEAYGSVRNESSRR
ncbi:MAG: STM3941 family protein [Rudaea sp.]